jgi:hypothetical protein
MQRRTPAVWARAHDFSNHADEGDGETPEVGGCCEPRRHNDCRRPLVSLGPLHAGRSGRKADIIWVTALFFALAGFVGIVAMWEARRWALTWAATQGELRRAWAGDELSEAVEIATQAFNDQCLAS